MRKSLSMFGLAYLCLMSFHCQKKPAAPEESAEAAADSSAQANSVVPAGVTHLENPAFVDKPTPTDMPEFDGSKAETSWAGKEKEFKKRLKAACKDSAAVYTLNAENSQIGYVSYKNKELPVAGMFEKGVGVFAQRKATATYDAWFAIDPLSLVSGDDVRDRKLLKLFFELEKDGTSDLSFEAKGVQGALPGELAMNGTMALHGKTKELALPISATRTNAGGVELALKNANELLQFGWFDLIEPLKALIASCNHSAMGEAAKLDIKLSLDRASCQ